MKFFDIGIEIMGHTIYIAEKDGVESVKRKIIELSKRKPDDFGSLFETLVSKR